MAGGLAVALAAVAVFLAIRPDGAPTPAAGVSTAPTAATTTTTPPPSRGTPPTVPAKGALVGAWVKPPGGGKDVAVPTATTAYQRQAGRRLDIVHMYRTWEESFPGPVERFAVEQGSIPMISWDGTKTSDILAGTYDDLIRERAAAIRALNAPVFLRWFWEMDRPDAQAEVGSPAAYSRAWRHIRRIFDQAQVRNVSWVWCPTSYSFGRGYGPRYYPGDDAVDWTCADGYSGGTQSGKRVRSFEEVFRAFYDWAAKRPKPIMIGEFGVQKGAGDQGQWLRDAGTTLQNTYPRIKALVYFDSVRQGGTGGELSWSLRDSATGMQALRGLLKEPYFNTRRLAAVG